MERRVLVAQQSDIPAIGLLYDAVNDNLAKWGNVNAPQWQKGRYPTADTARQALEAGTLFVCKQGEEIIGGMVLNSDAHYDFHLMPWTVDARPWEVLYLHTLVVHPAAAGQGVAKTMLDFAVTYSRKLGMKAIRMDAYAVNTAAERLYCSFGFTKVLRWTTSRTGVRLNAFEYKL